jgi:hypothetical protein
MIQGWLERDDTTLIAANDGPFKHHLDRYKYPRTGMKIATRWSIAPRRGFKCGGA